MCASLVHTSCKLCRRKWKSFLHQTQQQWCPLHFRRQDDVPLPQRGPSTGTSHRQSAEPQGEHQTHPAGTLAGAGGAGVRSEYSTKTDWITTSTTAFAGLHICYMCNNIFGGEGRARGVVLYTAGNLTIHCFLNRGGEFTGIVQFW